MLLYTSLVELAVVDGWIKKIHYIASYILAQNFGGRKVWQIILPKIIFGKKHWQIGCFAQQIN